MTGVHPEHAAPEPGDPIRGWQRHASQPADERAAEMLFTTLTPASQALLHSQAGCYAGRAFTELELPSQQFRVALLRRLRMPLPIAPRRCGCGNDLEQYGDHRAACATTSALAARAPALETAVARICREAGGRVARNVAVANMNLASPITDGRRIEIVAIMDHGQQLAIEMDIMRGKKTDFICSKTPKGCAQYAQLFNHTHAWIDLLSFQYLDLN